MNIQNLTALLSVAVGGDAPAPLPKITPELASVARKHDVAHLLAYGAQKVNAEGTPEVMQALEGQLLRAVFRYENLQYEYGHICKALEDASVDYMPLKGAVLRRFYPEPMMRTSCDTDILVRPEDVDRACKALTDALSYTVGRRTAHDVTLTAKSGTHAELHFDLIEDGRLNDKADRILAEVWERSAPESGTHMWAMPDELFYFYHIAHMAKHVMLGGCGIRPFLDLHILDRRGNRAGRDALLAEGGLKPFADACRTLAEKWFAGRPGSETVDALEGYILSGGIYGNMENHVSAQQSRTSSKLRYFSERIWLPENQLIARFPKAKGRKWLYPFFQARRWLYVFSPGTARRSAAEMKMLKETKKENNPVTRMLQDLGLT